VRLYFIRKKSRVSIDPYLGPTCELAGVEPGRWYESRAEAEQDVAKLTQHNPVGFDVLERDLSSAPVDLWESQIQKSLQDS
jgi:hypothetical protein